MGEKLGDEAYARAALTYLAEPADRWLARLVRGAGAPAALAAVRDYDGRENRSAGGGRLTRDGAAMKAAMERWRARLADLPTPEEVLAFRAAGIRLVTPEDPEWPTQLADLGDEAPYALWLRGSADLRFNCLRSAAVVGSRAATAYGAYVAAELSGAIAARGLAVVSGGAFGIDAAAHRGALGADGVTIAVLAGGVDMPYPAAHDELFDAIAGQGLLVSEWPPGRNVTRLRFLVRNRVIAALAAGTVVVEAAERSGALNTARYARDLSRRLMAVPGPVTSDTSAGCHRIIREWQATLVTSGAEVAEHLEPVGAALGPQAATARAAGSASPGGRSASARTGAPAVLPRDQLDRDSARVLDALPARGGMATLRVAQRAGLAPTAAATLLGRLATGGFVERCDQGWRLRR